MSCLFDTVLLFCTSTCSWLLFLVRVSGELWCFFTSHAKKSYAACKVFYCSQYSLGVLINLNHDFSFLHVLRVVRQKISIKYDVAREL